MGSFFTPLSWNDSGFILTGVMNTITISLVAIIAGTLLGLVVGFIRSESNKLTNSALGAVLDILRSVPLIIQLILFTTYIGRHGPSARPVRGRLNCAVAVYHGVYGRGVPWRFR